MKKRQAVSSLEAHLGFWLRFVSNHVSQSFARKLAEHDVSVAEWVILRELFDTRSALPSVLADRHGLTRGAVTKIGDRLLAKGLLTRRADAHDGRVQALHITNEGRLLVPRLAALADENEAAFFGHLSARDYARVMTLMKDVVQKHGLKGTPVA